MRWCDNVRVEIIVDAKLTPAIISHRVTPPSCDPCASHRCKCSQSRTETCDQLVLHCSYEPAHHLHRTSTTRLDQRPTTNSLQSSQLYSSPSLCLARPAQPLSIPNCGDPKPQRPDWLFVSVSLFASPCSTHCHTIQLLRACDVIPLLVVPCTFFTLHNFLRLVLSIIIRIRIGKKGCDQERLP